MSDFTCDVEITELTFFQNFIGQVSTILFLNKAVNEEHLKLLKDFNCGLYSEKKINQFLKIGNSSFLANLNF